MREDSVLVMMAAMMTIVMGFCLEVTGIIGCCWAIKWMLENWP